MQRPTCPLPDGLLKELAQTRPDEYSYYGHVILSLEAKTDAPQTLNNQRLYWTGKGFQDWQESPDGQTLTARRGTECGNMLSFNVSKLQAEITLTHRDQTLYIKLDTNTVNQVITLWNYLDLKLQIHEADHLAQTGEGTPELWQEYKRLSKFALNFDWRTASLFWDPPYEPYGNPNPKDKSLPFRY